MTLFALFSSVIKRLDRHYAERKTLRELESLSPELLRDVGLRVELGHIYDLSGNRIETDADYREESPEISR